MAIAPVPVDAAVTVAEIAPPPEPPQLVCESGTSPRPASPPELAWHCAREDGVLHGPFVALYPDHAIEVRGNHAAGLLDGAWERRAPNGTVIEAGTYAAGKKHGTWTQTSPAGAPLGSYEMVHGSGVERRWYDDGALYRELRYKAGVLDGPYRVYTRDGVAIETGRYKLGRLDGARAFGTRTTLRFEETFVDGVRRGNRKIWHQNALLADEEYDRRGRLDGPYAQWRRAKVPRLKGQYAAGKRVGEWEWNDRDGKKEREGGYVDGKRDGAWLEWTDEKLVFSGSYTAGKPDGTFTYFTKTGLELGSFTITDGTGWMFTYWAPGKIATKQRWIRGAEDGPYQELTKLGKVVVEGRYAGGVKHGLWRELTPDGVVVLEETWKRGKLDGKVKKFVDGKPSMVATYVAGRAEGPYTEYRGERPAVTGQFAADQRTGTWTTYDAAGAVIGIASYKAGVLDGTWRSLRGGVLTEGAMREGRRTGVWLITDRAGRVERRDYR